MIIWEAYWKHVKTYEYTLKVLRRNFKNLPKFHFLTKSFEHFTQYTTKYPLSYGRRRFLTFEYFWPHRLRLEKHVFPNCDKMLKDISTKLVPNFLSLKYLSHGTNLILVSWTVAKWIFFIKSKRQKIQDLGNIECCATLRQVI